MSKKNIATLPDLLAARDDARRLAQAKEFLALLDPRATHFTFQTFGEGSEKGEHVLTSIMHGKPEDLVDGFEMYNGVGAGLFVTVNETDLQGRKAENIQSIRAVWCDYDSEKQKEPRTLDKLLKEFPLPPSLIVSTSQDNCHFYWLVSDRPKEGLGEAPFRLIMERMVESYGCDKNACDIARVLRLPGYKNNKRDGWTVTLIKDKATGARYTRAQLLDAFPPVRKAVQEPKTVGKIIALGAPDWEQEKGRLRNALKFVSAEDRNVWLMVSFAIFDASRGADEGFEIWDTWSQTTTAGNYDKHEQERCWYREFPNRKYASAKVSLNTVFGIAIDNGWTEQKALLKPLKLPTAGPIPGGLLTSSALAGMRETYRKRDLKPSEAQWAGIQHAIAIMEQMAEGAALNRVYLSPLDPGVGKTQAVSHFIPVLLDSEAHKDVSCLICVGRLNEIPRYIEEMGDPQDYSITVADDKANRWLNREGNQNKTEARVMFTTQQLVESRSRRAGSFAAIDELSFKGKSRQVRIWDEAMLPGRPVLLDLSRVEGLTNPLKTREFYQLFGLVNDILTAARTAKSDDLLTIPDLHGEPEFQFYEFIEDLKNEGEKEDLISAAEDLAYLSGKTVRIHKDNLKSTTLLDYENTLAEDLAPILVLDASGRVRTTYSYWASHRGGLIKLTEVKKDYSNLICHVWRRGGSRSAWLNDIEGDLVREIVKEIKREPKKACLVVHPKARGKLDVKDLIEQQIAQQKIEMGTVKFLHWGDHAASNDYREYTKVILATLFYRPPAYYDAMARLSMGSKSEERLTAEQRDEITRGEHADAILQAVCRASVRKPLEDGCQSCDVYIIASPRTLIDEDLQFIFPGCKIENWAPIPNELKGHQKKAYDLIRKRLNTQNPQIRQSEVLAELGIHRANFEVSELLEEALGKHAISYIRRRGKEGSFFCIPDLS